MGKALKRPEGTLDLYGCEITSSLDFADVLHMRLNNAKGIAALASVFDGFEETPDDTLSNAMWALIIELNAALEAVEQFSALRKHGEVRHD